METYTRTRQVQFLFPSPPFLVTNTQEGLRRAQGRLLCGFWSEKESFGGNYVFRIGVDDPVCPWPWFYIQCSSVKCRLLIEKDVILHSTTRRTVTSVTCLRCPFCLTHKGLLRLIFRHKPQTTKLSSSLLRVCVASNPCSSRDSRKISSGPLSVSFWYYFVGWVRISNSMSCH